MLYGWTFLFVILLIIEFITVGLVTIWFAFGALVALLVSLITDSIVIQTIVFFVSSILSLIITRPLLKKYFTPQKEKLNCDKLIKMTGVVTKSIEKYNNGEVKVDGKYWTAKSDKKIEEGSKVEILSIEGVKLIVKEKEEEK